MKAHEQEIEYLQANIGAQTVVSCDLQGDVKVWDILSGECKTFIRRSNFKSPSLDSVNQNRHHQQNRDLNGGGSSFGSDSTLSSSLSNGDDNELLNDNLQIHHPTSNGQIQSFSQNNHQTQSHQSNNHTNSKQMNGGTNGYDFAKFYHKTNFSNNFITKYVFNAKTDSTDKIYNNDDISSEANITVTSKLKFQSIWSVHQNDKLVFLGCSNGRFEVWHSNSGELCYCNETCDSGVTQISSNNHKLIVSRLSGFIEIYEQELKANNSTDFTNCYKSNGLISNTAANTTNTVSLNYITFKYLQTINAHKQPITCLKLDDKYMLTGSSDNLIRVFKFEQLICSSVFTLHGHFGGLTCLEIDRVLV